jgi:hypothetical protein
MKYLKSLHLENTKGRVGSIHRSAEKEGVLTQAHVVYAGMLAKVLEGSTMHS